MFKTPFFRLACTAVLPQLGCSHDNSGSDTLATEEPDAAGATTSAGCSSSKSAGDKPAAGKGGAGRASDELARDAAVSGDDDAGVNEQRVSKPGEYRGYGDKLYDGYALSSEYVAVRDGTLAPSICTVRKTPRLDPVPTVTIYRDAQHPSTITLPVITL